MSRGGQKVRSLAVAVAVAGAGAAWAAKLDKTACAALSSELAAIKNSGIKADMERGPEWAKANMPPERLQSALRLLELEDQLEFRCSMRGIAKQQDKPEAPGTSAAPASSSPPDSKRAAEQPSLNNATAATENRAGAPAMLAPVFKPPVAMQSTHLPPAPPTQRTSTVPPAAPTVAPAAAAPTAVPSTAPATTATTTPAAASPGAPATTAKPGQPPPVVANTPPATVPPATTVPVTKSGPLPSAAATTAPPTTAQPAPGAAPATKNPSTAAARKKNPRRNSSSAYVSPGDVNSFSLPGMGNR
jgi:hypothetical protein